MNLRRIQTKGNVNQIFFEKSAGLVRAVKDIGHIIGDCSQQVHFN